MEAGHEVVRRRHGHDHHGAHEQESDGAHRDGDGDRGHDDDAQFERPHRQALAPGVVLVGAHGEQLRCQAEAQRHDDHGHDGDDDDVRGAHRGERAEEVLREHPRTPARDARHEDAGGQPAVEEDGQPDVGRRPAALAGELDGDRAGDAHGDGDRCGRPARDQGEADAGDGHVAQAVAEQ